MKKVSVIIPVYNSEEFLRQCLDSLINQTLEDIEIICVDDGSTDGSRDILEEYARGDERVRVIVQKNKYAGVARNNGMKSAEGEYLIFLDSDDFFAPDLLEKTYNQAVSTDADVVLFGAKKYDMLSGEYIDTPHYFNRRYLPEQTVFSGTDVPDRLFLLTTPCPWTKLFRREFVSSENLRFQPIQNSNDVYFVLTALAVARRISYVDDDLVYYRVGRKENLQSGKDKNPTLFFEAYRAVYDELTKRNIYDQLKKSFAETTISGSVYNLNTVSSDEARLKIYRTIASDAFDEMKILDYPMDSYLYPENVMRLRGAKNVVKWHEKLTREIDDSFRVCADRRNTDCEPKVSVIIPVYNTAAFLEDCLKCIQNQTLEQIEIICVNDGSTDNSREILSEHAQSDPRMVLVEQSNKGQSSARNSGIKMARGKYVYFMDSDDLLDVNALEILCEKMEQLSLDVIYFDGSCFANTEDCESHVELRKTFYCRKQRYDGVYSGARLMAEMLKNEEYRCSPCLQMINRQYLCQNDLLFREGIIHEDQLWNFKCILSAERAAHLPKQLFRRRYRTNSTMTRAETFADVYGYFCCYMEMKDFYDTLQLDEFCDDAALEMLNCNLHSAATSYMKISGEERESIFALPRYRRLLFKLYVAEPGGHRVMIADLRALNKKKSQRINDLQKQVKELQKSRSYRIGRRVLSPFSKARKLLRTLKKMFSPKPSGSNSAENALQ